MLHDIKEFIHYKYDDEKKVVVSTYGKVEELKWLTLKGRRRVTLRRNKNPHWLFENQINKMLGLQIPTLENKVEKLQQGGRGHGKNLFKKEVEKKSIVVNSEGEVLFKGKDKEAKEVVRKIEDNTEFWIKFDEVKKFLKERQKPFRRDQFQTKFGKEFLEECIEGNLLEEIKMSSFKFYNLKK